jgi:hypothetical protein
MNPGDSIIVKSLRNHHNDLHRVYDIPDVYRWIGKSVVPRSFIGKIPGGSLGIILETKDNQVKVLFQGGLIGWIKNDLVEVVDPQQL